MSYELSTSTSESLDKKDKSQKYRALTAVGFVAMMGVKTSSLEQKDVESGTEAQTYSVDQFSTEDQSKFETSRESFVDALDGTVSFHDVKTILTGASVEIGGQRWIFDGNDEVRSLSSVTAAIDQVYEGVLDEVQEMDEMGDLTKIQLDQPDALKAMPEVAGAVAEKVEDLARYAFAYDHPIELKRGEESFQSIEQHTTSSSGLEYSIHSLVPEGSEDKNMECVMPGYATTEETYKRFAIDMAFQGKAVSVMSVHDLNPEIDSSAQFGKSSNLPGSYAEIAYDSLSELAGRGEKNIDCVAYSTGAIGLTYAAVEHKDINIENLTLISPVGLHTSDDYKAASWGLFKDVVLTHLGQIGEASSQNKRTQEIHEDISEGPGAMKSEAYSGQFDRITTEINAGEQVISVNLEDQLPALSEKGVNVQIISFDGDVFSVPGHINTTTQGLNVEHVMQEGFHSTIKYSPEIVAGQVRVLQK